MSDFVTKKADAIAALGISKRVFEKRVQPLLTKLKPARPARFLVDEIVQVKATPWLMQRAGGRPSQAWSLRAPRGNRALYYVRFRFEGKDYELSTGERAPEAAEAAASAIYERKTNPPRLDGPGVYAVRAGKFIKVGKSSTNMLRRLFTIQTSQAEEIEVIGIISTNPDDEKRAHAALDCYHVRGEWFEGGLLASDAVEWLCTRGLP